MSFTVAPELEPHFLVTEVAQGDRIVAPSFQRIFEDSPPPHPHHIIAFYIGQAPQLVPVSYVHFWPFGDICLVGGGMTDGQMFQHMSEAARDAVRQANGLLLQTLRYGFAEISPRFDATFGYCGDERARSVDLEAGFEETAVERLLIYRPRPLHVNVEKALLAKAEALGPF